jgi:uncharacterized protein YxeA
MESTKFMGFTNQEIMFGVVGIVIIIIISCIISSTMTSVSSETSVSKTVSISKTPDSDLTINNSSKRFEESSQTKNISSSNIINL